MNLTFIPVVVTLTGLFGLAFALFGALTHKRGGKLGKLQPDQPCGGSSSTKKDFHHCATPGCKFSIPGQDPHRHCFTCLTLDHDINTCGPCLTSPPNFQQCRAMRLFLWNCEPRSLPLPVCPIDKGITRLALQLGSIKIARRWLGNWNLAFLVRRASCHPLSVCPLTSGSGALAYMLTLSGSQPQVTGSPRVVSLWSPGSVLPTFEDVTELAHQQTSSSVLSSV